MPDKEKTEIRVTKNKINKTMSKHCQAKLNNYTLCNFQQACTTGLFEAHELSIFIQVSDVSSLLIHFNSDTQWFSFQLIRLAVQCKFFMNLSLNLVLKFWNEHWKRVEWTWKNSGSSVQCLSYIDQVLVGVYLKLLWCSSFHCFVYPD